MKKVVYDKNEAPGCSPARNGTTIATQLQDKLRKLEMQRTKLAEELQRIVDKEKQNKLEILKVKHDRKIAETLHLANERLTKSKTTYVQERLKRVNEQLENIHMMDRNARQNF